MTCLVDIIQPPNLRLHCVPTSLLATFSAMNFFDIPINDSDIDLLIICCDDARKCSMLISHGIY
jgi:hypothetical protein